jgi:hypothetical protein
MGKIQNSFGPRDALLKLENVDIKRGIIKSGPGITRNMQDNSDEGI